MDDYERNVKKLYNNTASMVANLFFKGHITEPEMNFLLSLLDNLVFEKSEPELINVLKKWFGQNRDEENMAIVKNTLINIDLKNPADIQNIINLIKELS